MRMLPFTLLVACTTATPPVLGEISTEAGLYSLDVSTDPATPVTGEVVLTVSVFDDVGSVTGAEVRFIPTMPDMGHGVDPVEVTEVADGVYEGGWTFAMPGYWEVEVGIDADAGADVAVLSYDVE